MDRNGWTTFASRAPTRSDCLDDWLLVWHVYRGAISVRWEDRQKTPMITHWQRMPKEGWISAAERKPTRADADIMGCVLARHLYDGIMVTGWRQFDYDRYMMCWLPTPGAPEDHPEHFKRF